MLVNLKNVSRNLIILKPKGCKNSYYIYPGANIDLEEETLGVEAKKQILKGALLLTPLAPVKKPKKEEKEQKKVDSKK